MTHSSILSNGWFWPCLPEGHALFLADGAGRAGIVCYTGYCSRRTFTGRLVMRVLHFLPLGTLHPLYEPFFRAVVD